MPAPFRLLVLVLSIFLAASARAETVVPAKGQSAEQVQKDTAECAALAKQSSGYDPAQPAASPAVSVPTAGAAAAPGFKL